MKSRRDFLSLIGLSPVVLMACAGANDPSRARSLIPMDLPPLRELVAIRDLQWLIDVDARKIAEDPAVMEAILRVVPAKRLDAFREHSGGVDLRSLSELVVARHRQGDLVLVKGVLAPERIEQAFKRHSLSVDARRIESSKEGAPILVLQGTTIGNHPNRAAMLGRQAAFYEEGAEGPLKVALAFAEKKLHRTKPAVLTEPLAPLLGRIAGAHVRCLAPGPFVGAWADALGGLMRASTAGSLAIWLSSRDGQARATARIELAGAWGEDSARAASRLASAIRVVASSDLGKLMGLHEPLEGPSEIDSPTTIGAARTPRAGDMIGVEVSYDLGKLCNGIHRALDAEIGEILDLH